MDAATNLIKRDVAAGQFLESSLTEFLSYPFIVCLSEFAGDPIRASSSDSLRLTVRVMTVNENYASPFFIIHAPNDRTHRLGRSEEERRDVDRVYMDLPHYCQGSLEVSRYN